MTNPSPTISPKRSESQWLLLLKLVLLMTVPVLAMRWLLL